MHDYKVSLICYYVNNISHVMSKMHLITFQLITDTLHGSIIAQIVQRFAVLLI